MSYDMYVDAARTRLWGSTTELGLSPFQGSCFLDDRNRVCTIVFPIYGKVYGGQTSTPPGKYQGALLTRLNYRFSDCRQ